MKREKGSRVDFDAVRAQMSPVLRLAAARLLDGANEELLTALGFFRITRSGVEDAARFRVLSSRFPDRAWWDWPAALRDRSPEAIAELDEAAEREIGVETALAFLFDRQWAAIAATAVVREVSLIGDLPIYVAGHSADVWTAPSLFELDDARRPVREAGVPPDAFSATGQRWENPLFDWEAMAASRYRWWKTRFQTSLRWTSILRIDHFRGFAAYYAIPVEAEDARTGRWEQGPGVALFRALDDVLEGHTLIAEDLGDIDEEVHRLRRQVHALCTRVFQFALNEEGLSLHAPDAVPYDAVYCSGTHDNDTTRGWLDSLTTRDRQRVGDVVGVRSQQASELLVGVIDAVLGSSARVAVLPVQDVLALGSEARLNTPGTAHGNWGWRLDALPELEGWSARLEGFER